MRNDKLREFTRIRMIFSMVNLTVGLAAIGLIMYLVVK